MEEAFNPYRDWLGIEGGRPPGNHYELLGIDLFEGDPGVIAQAADVLTARIRGIRPGPHLAEWQRLIDAVAGARTCLLDPAAKAAYDASLQAQPSDPTPGSPPPQGQTPVAPERAPPATPGQPAWQPPGQPTAPEPPPIQSTARPAPGPPSPHPEATPLFPHGGQPGGVVVPSVASRRVVRRPRSGAQIAVYLVTLVLLIVAGVFGYMLYQRRSGAPTGDRAVSQADPKNLAPGDSSQPAPKRPPRAGPGGKPPEQRQPDTRPAPNGKPKQEAGQPPGRETQPTDPPAPLAPVDRERQEAFRQSLAVARVTLSEHDLAAARTHLESAASDAQTPEEQAEVDRLDTLLGHLDEFWKAMRGIVGKLQPADTLPVGETIVAVVEATPEELTLKVAGRVRTYPTDDLPSKLVQALADARFAKDPATKVIVGTYHLVDPDGDAARARQLWAEAAQQGVDVEDLMPELTAWGDASAPRAGPTKPEEAEQAVKEKFKEQYAQATGAAGKAQLASELFSAGEATTEDPELRSALFREARDMAIAAGDAELAFQAIERLAGLNVIDVLAVKAEALTAAAKNARGSSAQQAIVQTALRLVEYAVVEGQIEQARALAELALSAARKSNSRPLMEQAKLVVEQVEARQKQGKTNGTQAEE
ncbi:MAG TPA: hypothetical protein VMY37_06360 [Thermoguttaceae bacterium]|nr:hypothetical protein [Thermoguttaceae bacterium]